MTPVDHAEAERTVKAVVLWSMLGLLVGLTAATIMVSIRVGREEGKIEEHQVSHAPTQIHLKQSTARSDDAVPHSP